ncbi:cytochrome P450 [Mycena amicta]|nr:cytochrome P450 [Mycena amicta]
MWDVTGRDVTGRDVTGYFANILQLRLRLALLTLACFVASRLVAIIRQEYRRRETISKIPGPPSPSWIFGNLLQTEIPKEFGAFETVWNKTYGAVYRFKGSFGRDRLMVSDPTALQFIYNSDDLQNAPSGQALITWLFTEAGIATRRGKDHRQLRAALNVGFTPAMVRNYQPIFESVAHAMSEKLETTLLSSQSAVVDMVPLLNDATLSAISEAALGCPVEELSEDLIRTSGEVLELSASVAPGQVLADEILNLNIFPRWLLRQVVKFPVGKPFKILRDQTRFTEEDGRRLVQRKLDLAKESADTVDDASDVYTRVLHESVIGTATKAQIEVEDLVKQTSTILLAGQDTTAITLAFVLAELSRRQALQDDLRKEIDELSAQRVSYDHYPLLNALIKVLYSRYQCVICAMSTAQFILCQSDPETASSLSTTRRHFQDDSDEIASPPGGIRSQVAPDSESGVLKRPRHASTSAGPQEPDMAFGGWGPKPLRNPPLRYPLHSTTSPHSHRALAHHLPPSTIKLLPADVGPNSLERKAVVMSTPSMVLLIDLSGWNGGRVDQRGRLSRGCGYAGLRRSRDPMCLCQARDKHDPWRIRAVYANANLGAFVDFSARLPHSTCQPSVPLVLTVLSLFTEDEYKLRVTETGVIEEKPSSSTIGSSIPSLSSGTVVDKTQRILWSSSHYAHDGQLDSAMVTRTRWYGSWRKQAHSERNRFPQYTSAATIDVGPSTQETLCFYPVVPFAYRIANTDTVMPLSESITTTDGQLIDRILICKGQLLTLSVRSYQRLESRWGADAEKFDPSRWIEGRVPQSDAIGPYANLILEIQVLVCELIGNFVFDAAVDEVVVPRHASVLMPADANGKKRAAFVVKKLSLGASEKTHNPDGHRDPNNLPKICQEDLGEFSNSVPSGHLRCTKCLYEY